MIDLQVFLNTRVEQSGTFAWIGDMGLSPVRYFFHGKTFSINPVPMNGSPVVLESKSKGKDSCCCKMFKTALAIVLFVPGIFLVIFKALAYLSADVRKNHLLIKRNLIKSQRAQKIAQEESINKISNTNNPVLPNKERHIGSPSKPITSESELMRALAEEAKNNPPDQYATSALIIYGKNLAINAESGILQFQPMKLILIDATIVLHKPPCSCQCLDEAMYFADNWQIESARPYLPMYPANSIQDALRAKPDMNESTQKPYQMIYFVLQQNPNRKSE